LLPVLHRSDRWPAPVRPVATAATQQMFQRASSDFSRPWNKNTPKTQPVRKKNPSQILAKQIQTDQELTSNSTAQRHTGQATYSRKIRQRSPYRSDRSLALVRPVTPGQLGMNHTRRSTPQKPTPDLQIRSMDPNKTLAIVGTRHGHSIAKLWSTKTR
jgi:hypothetical protein